MSERKHIKPRSCFPETKQGWIDYNAQFESELQQIADEEIELDKAMDAQHQAREEGTDIIDDMSVREGRL